MCLHEITDLSSHKRHPSIDSTSGLMGVAWQSTAEMGTTSQQRSLPTMHPLFRGSTIDIQSLDSAPTNIIKWKAIITVKQQGKITDDNRNGREEMDGMERGVGKSLIQKTCILCRPSFMQHCEVQGWDCTCHYTNQWRSKHYDDKKKQS